MCRAVRTAVHRILSVCVCFWFVACGDAPTPSAPPAVTGRAPSSDTQAQLKESLTQAIDAAEYILKTSPNDNDALLAAALAAEHLGLAEKAIQYYSRLQESTQETEHLRKLAELQIGRDPAAAARHIARFFEQGGRDDRLGVWFVRHKLEAGDVRGAYLLTEKLTPPQDLAGREFLRDLCLRHSRSLAPWTRESLESLRRAVSFAALPAGMVETAALTFLSAGDAPLARDLIKTFPGPAYLLRAKIADKLQDPRDALAQRLKYFHSGGQDTSELLILLESLGRAPPARQVAEELWRAKLTDFRSRHLVAKTLAQFLKEASPPDTAAEIKFLEEAKPLGDPAFLERLADLQRALGNARAALAALRSRYPQSIPDQKADIYVTQALSAGEPDDALRVAIQASASALTPATRRRLAEILNASAEMELTSGRVSNAKNAALNASRFWSDLQTHKLLARISLHESDTAAALSHLSPALKMSPTDPAANYLIGKIFYSQSRWSEAKLHLQTAHAGRYPDESLPLYLGRILFSEKAQMAYPLLNEYAQTRGGQVPPDVQELLARSAAASGQTSAAAVWYERRLALGDDEQISSEYLSALTASGQKAKALGAARTLAVKYPSSRPILESASNVFDFSTDSVALLKTLESLSALEPDPVKKSVHQRRLLDVKLQMGLRAEADDLLTGLLDRFPNDAQLLTAAWTLRKGTPAAEPILRRLADIRSADDPIHLIRARQLMEDRQYAQAISVVRDFIVRKKTDADAYALLGEIHVQMGNKPEAAAAYRTLLKIQKSGIARQWLIGYIYDLGLSSLAGGVPLQDASTLYAEAQGLLGSEEKYKDLHEVYGKIFSTDTRTRALAIDAFQRELHVTGVGPDAPEADRKKRIQLTESLGKLYLADGQLVLARELFASSRSSGNRSPTFIRTYAQLLTRIGETEEADTEYRLLIQQLPYDREANLFMARRAASRGQSSEALKPLEALRTASPSDSSVLEVLGRAYMSAGRSADAADVFQKLVGQSDSMKHTVLYADALYQSGKHRTALHEYRALAASNMADLDQLRRLAELEQSQGNWSEAEGIILKLLRAGGADKDRLSLADVLRRIGDRAIQQGNAAEASRTAQRLLALRENDPTAFILMGRAKLLDGNTASALESFSRARSLAPQDPGAFLGMAEVELRMQRPVAAIDFAKKALVLDPSRPEAHTLIGLAYQRQGDMKNSYAALKNAILNSQNRALAHVRMGDLFLQNGKFNVALQQYRQALSLDPKNALAHLRNAVALHKLGFSENAMKELLTAMDLDPSGVGQEATVLLSEIFVSHGDVDRAREVLESAASKPTAPPSVLFRLGEIARRGGEYQKSIQFFRDAIIASDDPVFEYDVLNALGLSLTALNQAEAAEKTFKEAVRSSPRRPEALLNLSLYYRGRKDFLAAVDHARRAISAAPGNSDSYKLLGLIYYESGWQKESLSAFRESLRLSPDQPEILSLVRSIESAGAEEE